MTVPCRRSQTSLAERVRGILSGRGLTLADVSRASRAPGGNPLGHIPHTFYSSLEKQSFSPSLYQLHSLSTHSGYRLADWFALFGISLNDVSHFQLLFPSPWTVPLDANAYDPNALIPRLYDVTEADLATPLAPLSKWVALGPGRPMNSVFRGPKRTYRYLKIGSHDAVAFPDLLPGSIVRVLEDSSALDRAPIGKSPARTMLLVQHGKGITCSRIFRPDSETVVLCSRQLPYAPVELTRNVGEAVLGVVDVEIRSVEIVQKPVVPAMSGRHQARSLPARTLPSRNAGDFIQNARKACGISFREASERTRVVARELDDRRYYCSPGALSDYETRKFAPRHLHKLISICAVYFAGAADLLEACGAALDTAGAEAMPRDFSNVSARRRSSVSGTSRFLGKMEKRFGPLPYFLLAAGSTKFGLKNVSLRDVFWVGDSQVPKYSCLSGVRFLIVDRRQKRLRASLSSPVWAHPIYVLQKRGGGYLWGFCRPENGALSFCSSARLEKPLSLRKGVDVEIVGRVVGLIRKLI